MSTTPKPGRARPRTYTRRRRLSGFSVLVACVALAGVLLLMYPGIAAWFAQYEQSAEIGAYSDTIRDLDSETRARAIAEAEAYNQQLVGGSSAVVAANERKPLAGDEAQEHELYGTLLNADDEGLMARLRIPKIQADLPIFHGTSDEVLEEGVGHLEGSALPVGGESTHSVLTGHRGLATAELFTRLDEVAVDDTFTLEVFGEVRTYRVVETVVVAPEDTETLYAQPGRDLITLITCTPLGINSHRILVTGERVYPTPVADVEAAGQRPDVPGFPWWMVGVAATLAVLLSYVWLSSRPRRRKDAAKPDPRAPQVDAPPAPRVPPVAAARRPEQEPRPLVPVDLAVFGYTAAQHPRLPRLGARMVHDPYRRLTGEA